MRGAWIWVGALGYVLTLGLMQIAMGLPLSFTMAVLPQLAIAGLIYALWRRMFLRTLPLRTPLRKRLILDPLAYLIFWALGLVVPRLIFPPSRNAELIPLDDMLAIITPFYLFKIALTGALIGLAIDLIWTALPNGIKRKKRSR